MQFSFTEDQLLFRDTVRDFLANECRPEAVRAAWENDIGRIPGMWQQLGEMGVIGLLAPEAAGGFGMYAYTVSQAEAALTWPPMMFGAVLTGAALAWLAHGAARCLRWAARAAA